MKEHVLIISTGNQDLKIICKTTLNCNKPKIELAEIGKYKRRLLHLALIDGEVPYKIIATEEELKKQISDAIEIPKNWQQSKGKFIEINANKEQLITSTPFRQNTWENRDKSQIRITEALCNTEGQYLLFPAKLHTVINKIKAESLNIKGGLVFYTDRKKCDLEFKEEDKGRKKKLTDQYNQEPIATGQLLGEWLESEFSDSNFEPVNFLQGLYAIEGNTIIEDNKFAPYDQPIAQKSTHIIDAAIMQLSEQNPESKAIVSHTGGIADAKPVITSSAKLHFHGNILELHDSEHLPDDPVCLADTNQKICQILSRDAILDAKHRANQRLWEGDFAGAWAVVSHIQEEDNVLKCDPWVKKIKQISDFMEGRKPYEKDSFEGTVISKKFTTNGLIKLIWLAFKIEASLQSNQGAPWISETLRWICTFREKILEYYIIYCLHKDKSRDTLSISLKEWTINGEETIKSKIKRTPSLKIKNHYLWLNNIHEAETFLENTYPQDFELTKYQQFSNFLDQNIKTGKKEQYQQGSIRDYRNQLTHSFLEPELVEEIENYGKTQKLWNLDKNRQFREELGKCFLANSDIKGIFTVIDPKIDIEELYRDLLTRLIETISSPLPEDC